MRKSGIVCAVLLLAACKTTDTVDPSITTSVQVTSNPAEITVGETAQASAVVKDQNGQPLTGKSISWTSLNQSIATVNSSGIITGVAPGSATINGAADGVTGTTSITVVAPLAVCQDGPTTLNLAVGQVSVINVRQAEGCIKVALTPAQSAYVVIAANTNSLPDAFPAFTLRSDLGETVPSNTILSGAASVLASRSVPEATPAVSLQTGFETQLRATERRELRLGAAQTAYAAGTLERNPRYSVSAAIPVVGDKTQFKVPKSCSDFKSVTATVRFISSKSIIYTDDASPSGGFSPTELQEIATEFDNLIYPTDVEYFGAPLDLDANSRVVLLYTPEVNRLTPEGNPTGFVGGFFFAGDLFPANQCSQTNRAEVFYLLAPDPNGTINGNKRTTADVRQGTRGTIAHEFQHMINASQRISNQATRDLESIWLDEALAHFAEDLNGRVLRGLNETGNYTFEQLTNNGQQVNDYNAFFFQNFARFLRYASNPAINSPTSEYSDSSLADRGAAWSLLRYTADHYAPGGDIKTFIKSLVPGPDTGVANLRSKAGNVSFDSLTTGWMVANFADGLSIDGLDAKYSYKTYDLRNNVARANTNGQTYPLAVTLINASAFSAAGLQVRSASGAYFRFFQAAGTPRTFRMTNTNLQTAATFTGATLIVLRTQ